MQVIVRRDWLPFQFIHYDKHPYKMYLENNGHSAKVTFDPASCEDIPKLIQGNLPGRFFQLSERFLKKINNNIFYNPQNFTKVHMNWLKSIFIGAAKAAQDQNIHFKENNLEPRSSLSIIIPNVVEI